MKKSTIKFLIIISIISLIYLIISRYDFFRCYTINYTKVDSNNIPLLDSSCKTILSCSCPQQKPIDSNTVKSLVDQHYRPHQIQLYNKHNPYEDPLIQTYPYSHHVIPTLNREKDKNTLVIFTNIQNKIYPKDYTESLVEKYEKYKTPVHTKNYNEIILKLKDLSSKDAKILSKHTTITNENLAKIINSKLII